MLLNLCSAIIIICCLLLFWTYIITGARGTHITRIVINCRPHFGQTNINSLLLYTWVLKKFGIPFHYLFQAPPLFLILKNIFMTFFLTKTDWSPLYPAAPSPILFQSIMTKSWGTPWTRLSGVSSPLTVDFMKSRFVKARFCSKHFTVILAWLKKVVCYTKDFVI